MASVTIFLNSLTAVATATKEPQISNAVFMQVEPCPIFCRHQMMRGPGTRHQMELEIHHRATHGTGTAQIRPKELTNLGGFN
jgi:hypothetical protein